MEINKEGVFVVYKLQDLSSLELPVPFLNMKEIVTVLSSSEILCISHIKTAQGKELF